MPKIVWFIEGEFDSFILDFSSFYIHPATSRK
jgi:hypothetical protein